MVVVNWLLGKWQPTNALFAERMASAQRLFQWWFQGVHVEPPNLCEDYVRHVYREYNSLADAGSAMALRGTPLKYVTSGPAGLASLLEDPTQYKFFKLLLMVGVGKTLLHLVTSFGLIVGKAPQPPGEWSFNIATF